MASEHCTLHWDLWFTCWESLLVQLGPSTEGFLLACETAVQRGLHHSCHLPLLAIQVVEIEPQESNLCLRLDWVLHQQYLPLL